MKKFVTTEEIQKAESVHLLDFLDVMNEPVKKEGSRYYRHEEHNSLVFNEEGKWFWNSRQIGGVGAISFAKTFYDLDFPRAVQLINEKELPLSRNHTTERKKEEEKEFIYPNEYEVQHIQNAMHYLVNERGLDEKIVMALLKNGLMVEDKMKNIVFKYLDKNGELVGAERQGTQRINTNRGYFRGIMEASKGYFHFDVGTPKRIVFCESVIDSLSYFDLKRFNNTRYVSIAGLKNETLKQAVKDLYLTHPTAKENQHQIIIAVDNDKAGKGFIDTHWKDYVGNEVVGIDVPKNKDWNDDLKELRSLEKRKESVLSNQNVQNKDVLYQNER